MIGPTTIHHVRRHRDRLSTPVLFLSRGGTVPHQSLVSHLPSKAVLDTRYFWLPGPILQVREAPQFCPRCLSRIGGPFP